jgi:hypothetical protein
VNSHAFANGTIWMLLSTDDTHSALTKNLMLAEHEILIFPILLMPRLPTPANVQPDELRQLAFPACNYLQVDRATTSEHTAVGFGHVRLSCVSIRPPALESLVNRHLAFEAEARFN